MSAKAILIFIDGCGVPPANMPGSSPLYNSLGILNADYIMGKKSNGFQYLGLDAQMQVEGIPQSATGQASIFTGLNTQKIMNGHLVAYPTRPLVNLILKNSLFLKLKQINKNPVFINAYTEDYFRILRQDFGLDAMNYQITDTDGFTGNIILKLTEGLSSFIFASLKSTIMGSIRTKVGGLLLKPALKEFKTKFDYKEYGGAPLLGVRGGVIKAHGSSDARAFYNAIRQGIIFQEKDILEQISKKLVETK